MKYLKKFNESIDDSTNTPPAGRQKSLAISEFKRIIETNHTITSGSIESVLSEAYDKGVEVGEYMKLEGPAPSRRFKSNNFRLEPFIKTLMKKIECERKSNIRDLKYNGPEITANKVLVTDMTVKEAIEEMADEHADYYYFQKYRAEKDNFEESLKDALEDDEREHIIKDYNTLEVEIFIIKCFQVGYSYGDRIGKRLPSDVESIFDYMSMLKDVNSGTDRITAKLSPEEKEEHIKSIEKMINLYKSKSPDWEQYSKYFNI
jgi:hypothetical protein